MTEGIAQTATACIEGSPGVMRCTRMPSGFANANYRLETSAGVYLLRHRSGLDRSEVEFELDVLDWLQSRRFPAPAAIRFSGGERYLAGPDGSHLVLLEWLEGSEPESSESNVATIAHALGDLHNLQPPSGDWWRRENPIGEKVAAALVESLEPDCPQLFRFYAKEFGLIRPRLHAPLPSGLIHGDLFPDNTLFRDDELVAFLDFECACEDTLLFDVVMTIHGFCFRDEEWSPRLADVFLTAYNERRQLTEAEGDALPVYLSWCPLAMMGWHLRQLLRRPDIDNERRAGELARRVTTMKEANWNPWES